MADEFRMSLPASFFIGDQNTIIEAGDIAAVPDNINGRAVMKFPDGANESAMVSQSFSVPASDIWTSGSGVKVKVYYFGDGAGGGGGVILDVALECISESDAHDMHATADFFYTTAIGAAQTVDDAVDANAGELNVAVFTLTQAEADAIEPEDACRLCVRRDSADGDDDYAEAIYVTHVDMYEVTV